MRSAVFLSLFLIGVAAKQTPSMLKSLPFTRIADEIYDAEQSAKELSWKVSNSTAEKSSLQWFMASAMKELTQLQKVVMNATSKGSLGYQFQACVNRTEAQMPRYNTTLGLQRAIEKDGTLAPKMLEAEMYELYYAQRRSQEVIKDIGKCKAKCPVSLLKQGFHGHSVRKHVHEAPGGSLERASKEPNPQEMMRSIADAIYNTSQSIDNMKDHLSKDSAAKDVLKSLTSTVMSKLLKAKKEVEEMSDQLEVCSHTPETTHLIDQAQDIMGMNAEVSFELVKTAQDRTRGAREEAANLDEKLEACRKKCDIWYQYQPELEEEEQEEEE